MVEGEQPIAERREVGAERASGLQPRLVTVLPHRRLDLARLGHRRCPGSWLMARDRRGIEDDGHEVVRAEELRAEAAASGPRLQHRRRAIQRRGGDRAEGRRRGARPDGEDACSGERGARGHGGEKSVRARSLTAPRLGKRHLDQPRLGVRRNHDRARPRAASFEHQRVCTRGAQRRTRAPQRGDIESAPGRRPSREHQAVRTRDVLSAERARPQHGRRGGLLRRQLHRPPRWRVLARSPRARAQLDPEDLHPCKLV